MAIKINTGFSPNAPVSIDDRLILSKSEMLDMDDAIMPEVYPCWCKDDNKMYLYSKYHEFDEITGKFRLFESGGSGSGSKTSVVHSSVNGNVKVDGIDVKVYDDTNLREYATHTNQSILNKISVSDKGEMLFNNEKIGMYFFTMSHDSDNDVIEDTLVYDLKELINGINHITNSELLLQNKDWENTATVKVMDSGIELMSLTLSPNEVQKYKLGSSGKLKVFVNGKVYSKLDITYFRCVDS